MTTRTMMGALRSRIGAIGRPGWVRIGARSMPSAPGDGFTLPEYEGLIPCPRCGRTDCAWLVYDDQEARRVASGAEPDTSRAGHYCGVTGCRVRPEQLRAAAEEAGLPHTWED